jgi:hypothetical protein
MSPDPQQLQLLRAAASAQQLHQVMAGMRLHIAAELQRTLIQAYCIENDDPVLDDRETGAKLAAAAVMHADLLIEAAAKTPSAADGLLRR